MFSKQINNHCSHTEKIKLYVYIGKLRSATWIDGILLSEGKEKSQCKDNNGILYTVNNDCIKFIK